jgi:methionine-rich copper-binding protein CopC
VIRAALALALLLLPSAAAAHAALVRAVPGAREAVRVAPARVQLWFSERLEPAYSTLSVWLAETRVDRGDARVAPDDPRRLTVALPRLDRGRYVVKYRVLSVDGHIVEGAYPFTVTERAAAR